MNPVPINAFLRKSKFVFHHFARFLSKYLSDGSLIISTSRKSAGTRIAGFRIECEIYPTIQPVYMYSFTLPGTMHGAFYTFQMGEIIKVLLKLLYISVAHKYLDSGIFTE
jgi:hypothetical protein